MPPADTTGFYDVTRRVRQQGHVACALQGRREHPLILGTGPSLAPGVDLAPVGDETGKQLDVFVVDFLDLVYGEIADLAPRDVTRPAAPPPLLGPPGPPPGRCGGLYPPSGDAGRSCGALRCSSTMCFLYCCRLQPALRTASLRGPRHPLRPPPALPRSDPLGPGPRRERYWRRSRSSFGCPRPGLPSYDSETGFDVDPLSLHYELVHLLSELVPRHDGEPFRFLAPLTSCSVCPRRRYAEGGYRIPVRRVTHFGDRSPRCR